MISDEYYNKLAQVESSNNPLAQNPNSSAKGRFQFIDSTAKQFGLDKYEFGTPEYTKAETQAVKKFTADNYNFLKNKLNREPTKGELYLAHQQGAGGAEKLLTADDNARAVDVLGKDQVKLNGGNEHTTIAEFKSKWTSKFDDIEAKERGIEAGDQGQDTLLGGQGEDKVSNDLLEVDAFADMGINISGEKEIDAFSDFGVTVEDDIFIEGANDRNVDTTLIDQDTGAPSFIRNAVGSLSDPESRLATLQKYYPDAQPYDGDNFIFRHPETNKPTLYNPKGIDKGDFASLSREAFVTAGASVGGTVGAGASIPTGGTASPVTIAVGAGLGAGIGGNFYDLLMRVTGQTVDVRTPLEVVSETGLEVTGTMAGDAIGRGLPVLAKKVIGGTKQKAQEMVKQFERLGITPTMSTTQGGAVSGRLESGLSQNLVSAEIMQKQAEKVVKESEQALSTIVSKYGKAKTKEGAGTVIFEAAEIAKARLQFKEGELYEKAFDLVGADTLVEPKAINELLKEFQGQLLKAPESRAKTLKPAIDQLKAFVADSSKGGVDFQTLRAIRSDIGKNLADPLSSNSTASQNVAMKRVYAALSDDMARVSSEVSPDAAKAVKRADKFKKAYETTATKTLDKILKYDADERAYKFAQSASKDGGTSLRKLRKLFTQEEWDDVAATTLSKLGESPAQGDFSIAKFVTNYNKLAPEAKDALFRGGKYKEASQSLDDFVDLMSTLKDANKYTNTSNTAGALQVNMLMSSMAQGGGLFVAGSEAGMGGMAAAAGAAITPYATAKLITNPSFIKWLAQPVRQGTVNMTKHMGRLIAIGEANPELKESLNEYINAMEQNVKK